MNKEFQIFSLKKLVWIGFMLIFVLTACSGTAQPDSTQEHTPESEIQATQPEPLPPTEVPTATNTEEPTETEEGYPAPVAPFLPLVNSGNGYPSPELAYPPPLKTGLEATDPSVVKLVSGELQLVEFFAFW